MAEIPDDQVKDIKFVLRKEGKPQHEHPRKWNLPTTQEIALIALDERPKPGDIQIYLRGGGIRHIDDTNQAYDPLHYVLLFPKGEPGWSYHLKQLINGRDLTPAKYYRYLFMLRDETKFFNNLLWSGRLMQEFACTQFFKIERQRLKWVETNQTQVKALKYYGCLDAIHSNEDHTKIGDRIILPPTHYCR